MSFLSKPICVAKRRLQALVAARAAYTTSTSRMPPGTPPSSASEWRMPHRWCTSTASPPPAPEIEVVLLVSSGGGVAVTVTGGTPPYQYEWSKWNSSARVSMQEIFTTTQNLGNAPAGHSSLSVIDANGRKGMGSNGLDIALDAPLYTPPSVKITRTPACGADGELLAEVPISVSGGPFAYQWEWGNLPAGARATGLKVDRHYSLVVTNAAGCKSASVRTDLLSRFDVQPKVSIACNGDIDVTIFGYAGAKPTYEFSRSRERSGVQE